MIRPGVEACSTKHALAAFCVPKECWLMDDNVKGRVWVRKVNKEFVFKLGEELYSDMEEEIAKVQFSSIWELFNLIQPGFGEDSGQ